MRVLLVEDDHMIGESVTESLKASGYAVDWVDNGNSVFPAISAQAYDLMLLDLGLPGKDGLSILRQLRSQKLALPVVILTARDAVEDRIAGLDSGADDYLVKPFALGELYARMRAVLRRQSAGADSLMSNGIITLDPATREAALTDQSAVRLSAREFALLQALMMHPGTILSRAQLEDKIYGWGEEVESNAVEFLIYSLRKKFSSETIKNIRGLGWMVAKGS